ncbi:hypothetical protein AWR27_19600 [Spirosoma montaniterrae]|uniref:DUF4365 domain-containing protein n=1 Tax=Spirosoma montaniterrae TaxID=1178516 RepID=A0A1P9X120_9BACT|nr:hypothetical protein AWR27_19600 [Spirosoma montaniterrae]
MTFSVQWDLVITDAIHKTYRDEKRTTDWGAMCVAILLVRQFTRYTNFETTKTGDGIDFWLMEENGFDFAARLEVSGIRQQTKTNSITSRLERKKKQTQQSDATQLPAYIAITEFSKPEALFFLK